MDFNSEIYAGNKLNAFKRATGLPKLTIGDVHAIIKWCNLKPIRIERGVNGNRVPVYSRYYVESILRDNNLMMMCRSRILNSGNYKFNKRKEVPIVKNTGQEEPFIRVGKPKYRSDDMESASDELLRNDGVYYESKKDMNKGKRVYLTESQFKKLISEMQSRYLEKVLPLATFIPGNDLRGFEEYFASLDDEHKRVAYEYFVVEKKRIADQFIEIMQKYL